MPYLQFAYGGKEPTCSGLMHPTIAPYGAYTGSDGKAVLLSIQSEREWQTFCTGILHQPDLPRDPRFSDNTARVANRPALDAIISTALGALPRDEIIDQLEAARIAYGRVSSMADLAAHPQNRFVSVETPSGTVRMLAPGALVDGALHDPGPVPALGVHTDKIVAEFKPESAPD